MGDLSINKWSEVSWDKTHRFSFWTMMLWGSQENAGMFHCSPFTEKRLKALFKEVGFQIKEIKKYESHGGQALLISGVKN